MALKTIVKVGTITNLSDARYCAGMGVDMLGFRVIEGQDAYVAPDQFQEMRGWVTGPKIVAEIYGIKTPGQLAAVVEQYRPDYLELGLEELKYLTQPLPLPSILALKKGESQPYTPDFLLAAEVASVNSTQTPVLAEVKNVNQVNESLLSKVQGVALQGSAELRPGLKEYDLADILEGLETED